MERGHPALLDAPRADPPRVRRVAYVVSRFPKLTETFVLYELLAVQRHGIEVELYPLLREPEPVVHPESQEWIERAHYQPFLSGPILRSQLWFLLHRPSAYLGALLLLVRATLGSANYLFGGLAVFPKVAHAARLMERHGVEHVHCHFANHPAAAGFLIRRLTGIPYSFTAHGSDLHRDRHMLREKVREAAFVVAISDYNRRMIVEECGGFGEKVVVTHCGVDEAVFRPRGRAPAGGFTVLCVASLDPVKGHRHLVEAIGLLGDLDLVCLCVGGGPLRERIEAQIAEQGLAERVLLLGPKERREVVELLREADLFITASVLTPQGDREGIPVALMEAMATGLPVVASRISGIPELVDDGRSGLLVPPGDAEALAAAIRRLHDDPALRERLGAAARERIQAGFDLRRNAAAVAARFAAR